MAIPEPQAFQALNVISGEGNDKEDLKMRTQQISRNEWKQFFHDFSRFHQGWMISLDVFSQEFGAQIGTRDIPFEGMVVEESRDGKPSIELILGKTADFHLTHTIAMPTRVRFESQGENEVLQIEAENNITLLMSLHRAMAPAKVSYSA
jgi:hypothetical protein